MKINITGTIMFGLILLLGLGPLYGQDTRNTAITVNLIIDGSAALGGVINEVSEWISGRLVKRLLAEGDRITIWSAENTARVVYAGTVEGGAQGHIINALKSINGSAPSTAEQSDTPDFAGALREAAGRSSGEGITYTLLVSASPAGLSPTVTGPGAGLVRFSRIEEFSGWRAVVIALNIEAKVRQAASEWLLGA
ncbi:MAG: hypothetical protein LBD48_02670 [Treponema sp.]|jgi:hypothetical protein|nr:hypothetical protein [Treponema sp.]